MDQNNNQKTWSELLFGKKGSSEYKKFTDPKWTAKMGLIFALVLIIINISIVLIFKKYIPSRSPYGLAPIIIGSIGTYFGIKKKSGWQIIFLNILVICLGLLALISGGLLGRILEL